MKHLRVTSGVCQLFYGLFDTVIIDPQSLLALEEMY